MRYSRCRRYGATSRCSRRKKDNDMKSPEGVYKSWVEMMGATEEGSDNGVGATKANPTGKLLQQAWDGTGRAWRWRFKSYCRAIGWKEQLPHCLQPHLPFRYKCAPTKKREKKTQKRHLSYSLPSLNDVIFVPSSHTKTQLNMYKKTFMYFEILQYQKLTNSHYISGIFTVLHQLSCFHTQN